MVSSDVPLESLETEIQAMQHLNSKLVNVEPHPLANQAGRHVSQGVLQNGGSCWLRLQKWQPGIPLAKSRPHTPKLFWSVGHLMGRIASSLSILDFQDPHPELLWHPDQAPCIVEEGLSLVTDSFLGIF